MSKPALYLHVGQYKTGSSAIQNYLYAHRDSLPGVQYLYQDRANASMWMLRGFKQDLGALPKFHQKNVSAERQARVRSRVRRRLENQLATIEASAAVLSAESIGLFTPQELHDLRTFLEPHFSTITVLQYVRPMKSRLESAFQQKLKHRYASLDDPVKINYFLGARSLAREFGRDNLRFFKFDSAQFPRGDVVCHFLEQLGLPLPASSSNTDANLGLSLPAVQLLYAYRRTHRSRVQSDRVLLKRLAGLLGPPFRYHSTLYKTIVGARPRGVERFEALAGFSLDEDIVADDAIGIRNEADLLAIPDVAIDWLAGELGIPRDQLGEGDPQTLADRVAALAIRDGVTGSAG